MKSGFSRAHWRLDKRLLTLAVCLFIVAAIVYVWVGHHVAGR